MRKPRIRHKSRVFVREGRAGVELDGAPVSQAAYCDYILRGDWEARNREFAESGATVFHLTLPHGNQGGGLDYFDSAFWHDEGVYPATDHAYEYSLDRQAGDVLRHCPQARFYIKFMLSPPLRWTQKHPDEMLLAYDGRRFREASWASDAYLRGLARYVRAVVRFCENRTWADRIVGYMALPYGEGCTILTISGYLFDCSPAMTRVFRAWLRRRYRTDVALAKAWGEPGLTRAAAQVPRDDEWLRRRRETAPTFGGQPVPEQATNAQNRHQGLYHWLEPANAVREHDYCRCMREVFMRYVRTVTGAARQAMAATGVDRVLFMDAAKQPLLGWQILSNFDGIGDGQSFPNMLLFSGSWDLGRFLDRCGLDGAWNPADYTARTLGFAYESEGLTDSFRLRGKTAVVENDARCYVGAGIHDQGAFRDDREVEAGLLRNAALTLSRGVESYWCNVGSSYFHAPGIQGTIRRLVPMLERLATTPHRETRDAIAFVLDDSSPLCEDFTSGYQSLACIWQRVRGLAHCGVPYRIYLLSDLEKDNFPPYKVYLFPNLFRVDARVLRLLHRRVLRDGNVAIFGPATGITDGRVLSAAPASRLLGVPMELLPRSTVRHVIVQDAGHPISRELPASLVYGDTLPYGPTLVPADRAAENAGAVPLGHANLCWFIHRTGLFLKEFGRGAAGNGRPGRRGPDDYGILWSTALPLPPELLRAAARHAGCNIWCEDGDVVYASDSFAALHSVKAGPRVLRLPRRCRVFDALTDRPVGRGPVREVRLVIDPPATRLFRLEPAP